VVISPLNVVCFLFLKILIDCCLLAPYSWLEAQDKIADFEMKLMDIDSDHLGTREADRVCKDLSSIGDTGILLSHHVHSF
jgi:hypothetical protein